MVYVGVEQPVKLLPWRRETPAFCVDEVNANNQAVLRHFRALRVYYVGSHEGCGCGFLFSDWSLEDETLLHDESIPEHVKEATAEYYGSRKQSLDQLSQHLSLWLRDGEVELHACWAGEEAAEPRLYVAISPLDLTEGTFRFQTVAPGHPVHAVVRPHA